MLTVVNNNGPCPTFFKNIMGNEWEARSMVTDGSRLLQQTGELANSFDIFED